MACGHAKFTGEVGVCIATSGPGAIHLLNGLYDAKLDHVPVLAIVGQQKRIGARRRATSRRSTSRRCSRTSSEYVETCMEPAQARHLIDRGDPHRARPQRRRDADLPERRRRRSRRSPSPPREHGAVYSSVGYSRPRVVPQEADLERAAEILNEGEKVAMLDRPGRAATPPTRSIEAAELLGAGVAKALLGKAVAARRPPVRHRPDRPARDEAELRA